MILKGIYYLKILKIKFLCSFSHFEMQNSDFNHLKYVEFQLN